MITVNGAPSELLSGERLDAALARLGLSEHSRGIAVAIDGEVIPRSLWPQQRLSDGMKIELVGAIQGG